MMNKKQGLIIVTLVVLIACAGILAAKLNNPLNTYVNGNDTSGRGLISVNNNDKSNSSDYFAETRMSRDLTNKQVLDNLSAMAKDQNISKESRDTAAKKSTELTTALKSQSDIESQLKIKGFEDSICYVETEKVKVIVKSSTKLTEKQLDQIRVVVMGITNIKDITVEEVK